MLESLNFRNRQNNRNVAGYARIAVPVVICLVLALVLVNWGGLSRGEPEKSPATPDWPMWRYDAGRSAASPAPLSAELHLQWVRELGKPAPAWRQEQLKLQFDRSYEPVVMGRQIFVPSMVSDSVTAYDTETGEQNWRFFCNGPVRFAPIAWRGRVYAASDDGCLYCLDADDGKLLWKSSLAPAGRKLLGNGRLISAWPARGGPVLRDGRIYCSASIWPFMGVFFYALDAETGRMIWENSGTGAMYLTQQHNSPAFAGVAPQGYLTTDGNKLLVTSRTTPACFDCRTGEMLYYPLSDRSYGKYAGGYGVSLWNQWYLNNDMAYRLSDGFPLGPVSAHVMGEDAVVGVEEAGGVVAYRLAEARVRSSKDKEGKIQASAEPLWKMQSEPALNRIHIQAGSRVYGSNDEGAIAAIEVPETNEPATIVWRDKVAGHVWNMLAGDGKLFVVTEEGELYCFGDKEGSPLRHARNPDSSRPVSRRNRRRIEQILGQGADANGYCLWLGAGNGRLLMEAARQSQLHIVAIEPEAEKAARLRRRLDDAGLYGSRVAVLHDRVNFDDLPPYIASLVVVEDLAAVGSVEKMYDLLRPYSGVAWLAANEEQQPALRDRLANTDLPGVTISATDDAVVVKRTGPAPDSADWTHQYGDVANTVFSKDQVRPPLGILWFGEESAFGDILPRHGHGPPEQIVGGRLFIQGVDSLTAKDVYTGRVLWRKPLKEKATFGFYYDASYKHDFRSLSGNQGHIPGANARGTNFVVTHDRVYIALDDECHVLDPQTGQTLQVLTLPAPEGQDRPHWAYIGVYEDCLIAGASFVRYSSLLKPPGSKPDSAAPFVDRSVSKALIVMNRYDGKVLWRADAREGFIHNGITAGDGKVFCLDAVLPYVRRNARSDAELGRTSRLAAMDVRTGNVAWENHDCAFGTWLSFSEEFGVLVQAHRKSGDMLWEPGDRMAAFRAKTGEILWDEEMSYNGPCMIRGSQILTQSSAYDLLTGRQRTYPHPLTGETIPWEYSRNYGCGTAIASANLLTFRSAAAGYYDLTNDGGTGNFGGFRSGCTSNLIAANGVLNAPDYTSTCTCSYQNQTSLALVHVPDVEMWTFNKIEAGKDSIQRVGVNFGAPGDRKADNGTLWLEYPVVGGSSPDLDIAIRPEKPSWFRRHSLRLQGGDLKWVEASGAKGLRWVRVRVAAPKDDKEERFEGMGLAREPLAPERAFTVRLHFVEPEDKRPGQRRFDVALNEQTVLKDFDIVAEAGAPNVGIVKTFQGIRTREDMTISLTPADGDSETILCGIEIVAE